MHANMFSALQMVEWLEPKQVTDDAYSMQQNMKQTATAKKMLHIFRLKGHKEGQVEYCSIDVGRLKSAAPSRKKDEIVAETLTICQKRRESPRA